MEGSDVNSPFVRNLDKTTASMTPLGLNNLVLQMRPFIKKTKVAVVHKLVRQIKDLRKKKGTEEQKAKNSMKAERLGQEIDALKKINVDFIAKNSLANTKTIGDLGKQSEPEDRILLRLACNKTIAEPVSKWRTKHDDWKSLAAYLLSKNSARRYKKTKDADETKTKKPKKTRKREKVKPWEKKKEKKSIDEIVSATAESEVKTKKKVSSDVESSSESDSETVSSKTKQKSQRKPKQDNVAKANSPTKGTTKAKTKSPDLKKVKQKESDSDTSESGSASDSSSSETESVTEATPTSSKLNLKAADESSSEDSVSSDESSEESSDDDGSSVEPDLKVKNQTPPASKSPQKSEKQKQQTPKNKMQKKPDKEMIVKKLNLESLENDDDLAVDESNETVEFLFQRSTSKAVSTETDGAQKVKKRDSFFHRESGSDSDEESDSGNDTDHSGSDTDENMHNSGQKRQESTFIGSLSNRSSEGGKFVKRGGQDNRSKFQQGFKKSCKGKDFRANDGGCQKQRNQQDWKHNKSNYSGQERTHKSDFHNRQKPVTAASNKRPAPEDSGKLHPSWTASKKRKEQQSQIQAFQGKKTTFSDDD